MTNENPFEKDYYIIQLADKIEQAIVDQSANTKIVMQILQEQAKVNSALKDRVELLEQQVITILTSIKESQ